MEAVLGPDAPQGEGSVAGAGEVGLDGGQLLELGHEPGQRWSHDNGDINYLLSVSTPAAAGEAPDTPAPAGGGGLAPTVQCSTIQYIQYSAGDPAPPRPRSQRR